MALDNSAANSQAKTRTSHPISLTPEEFFKDSVLITNRYARSEIPNRNHETCLVLDCSDFNRRSLRRIVGCILEEIDENLFHQDVINVNQR